jgi:hypothetical protein
MLGSLVLSRLLDVVDDNDIKQLLCPPQFQSKLLSEGRGDVRIRSEIVRSAKFQIDPVNLFQPRPVEDLLTWLGHWGAAGSVTLLILAPPFAIQRYAKQTGHLSNSLPKPAERFVSVSH